MKAPNRQTKRYLVIPFLVSLISVLAAPGLYSLKNGVVNENNSKNKSTANNGALDDILKSLQSKVFAESDTYGNCWASSFDSIGSDVCNAVSPEDQNLCFKEGQNASINFYLKASGGNSISSASVVDNSGLLTNLSPLTTTYPSNTTDATYTTTFTAPAVSAADIHTDLDLGYSALFGIGADSATTHVRIEHVNTGPTVGSMSGDLSQVLPSSSSTINLPVHVQFNDAESNSMNVTFDLSTDSSFSNIIQSQTYTNVSAGTDLQHTFTSIGVGSYHWRARAVETNALGNCTGYGNADPAINLTTTALPSYTIALTSTGINFVSKTSASSYAANDPGNVSYFPVSVKFHDSSNLNMNIVFQLATDPNFNNIVKSGTKSGVSSNSDSTFTFSSVPQGNYYWRAIASDGTNSSTSPVTQVRVIAAGLANTGGMVAVPFAIGGVMIGGLSIYKRDKLKSLFRK